MPNARAPQKSKRPKPTEVRADYYEGVELAPCTLESLLTWDISRHAQCEQDRLNPDARASEALRGGR
jgi:hypothetical protein